MWDKLARIVWICPCFNEEYLNGLDMNIEGCKYILYLTFKIGTKEYIY